MRAFEADFVAAGPRLIYVLDGITGEIFGFSQDGPRPPGHREAFLAADGSLPPTPMELEFHRLSAYLMFSLRYMLLPTVQWNRRHKMRRITFLPGILLVAACTAPEADANPQTAGTDSELEGVFEYFGDLMGQSIMTDGRYVFLFGPADGSGPMTSHAGTYEIVGDLVIHTVKYHTEPDRVGDVFSWRIESTAGDTISFVTMDEAGEITGRGRSLRVR